MAEATIDSLKLEISSSSDGASKGLDDLRKSLKKLQSVTSKGLGLTAIVNELKAADASIKSSSLNGLTKAVNTLSKLGSVKISSSIGNQITAISTALQGANFDGGAQKMQSLVTALEPLGQLEKSNLSSYANALKKMPDTFKELNKLDMSAVTAKVQELATALKPLGDEMQKVANGFSAFPAKIQKLIAGTNKLSQSNNKAAFSYINLYAKLKMAWTAVQNVSRTIGKWITLSSDYTETMNLFTVSMGQYAEEAYNYAQTVGEAMGIDPAEWMESQGIFMTLTKGFGVASDRANAMSQQLTQLGYDLSSFFNISVEDAMTKLQSGISGELEPLRRLGYDLSQAKLEAVALSLGIDKTVSSMTQAEKAELRYYAILTQVTDAHGDMARTLNAPANQLRILNAQVTQLGRALGNFFIPLLNNVLPYIIASVKVLREVLDVFMGLLGIELSDVDFGKGSITSATDEVVDNLEEGQEEAKKLKSYLLGFDELNVLNADDGSDSLDDLLGSGFDFELPTYDFMDSIVSTRVDEIVKKMKEWLGLTGEIDSWSDFFKTKLGRIILLIAEIGALMAGWKIAKSVNNFFKNTLPELQKLIKSKVFKTGLGITMMITGITLELSGAYEIGYEGANLGNVLKTAVGSALGIAGSLLVFGTGPLGWTIGIGVTLATLISGFTMGVSDKLKKEDLEKRFGEYVLSDEEVSDLVAKLTNVPIKTDISLYLEQVTIRKNLASQVTSVVNDLSAMNFKIKLGLSVSEEEYKAAVDNYISSAEAYLEQQQITSALAVEIIFDDSATGVRLSEFVSSFYTTSYGELQALGEQLKKVVSEGFVNGVWIEDKFQEAIDLQKEIQEILDYMTDVEFAAKIEALKCDAASIELTPESFKDLLSEAQEVIDEQVKNLEGIRLEALKVAKMEYDQNILDGMSEAAARQIYDAAVKEADAKFREGKLELSYGTLDFGTDTIIQAYSEEIGNLGPHLQDSLDTMLSEAMFVASSGYGEYSAEVLLNELEDGVFNAIYGLEGLTPAVSENIGEFLKEFEPSIEAQEELAETYRKTGKAVPANIAEGLRDAAMLKALTYDVDSINYLLGYELSSSPEFVSLLLTCEDLGKEVTGKVRDGLNDNMSIVEDAANKTITLIDSEMNETVLDITPTLVSNLEQLGYDISDGLKTGIANGVTGDKKEYESVFGKISTWVKGLFGIHSPSKVFMGYGEYISEGLYNGVKNGLGNTSSWVNTNIYEPFKKAMGKAVSFTVTVKNDASTWWSNVKTWWGGKASKGVDLVVNATKGWKSTIKSALGIPDSVDLGFKLPKIGINWGSKELLGFKISYPKSFYTYAQGGFPDMGQMFIAREAGAELVGNIGGRTAVMNNDQIVESVSTGVYQAVLAALGGNNDDGGETNIVINLDGEKIYENQQKIARGRGYNLGMGAFSFG